MRRLAVLVVVLAGCGTEAEPLVVFAAASTADVSADLASAFERETGQRVAVSVGATSTLARQIAAGAPADAALLVGDEWVHWLEESSGPLASVEVARGALAVVVPREAPEWKPARLGAITEADRIAMADPSHVPAGRFARAMLEAAGLWEAMEPRVVPLPHVRAALAAVETGQAEAAVVYASDLAVSTRVRRAVPIPDSLQPHIAIRCVVTAASVSPRWQHAQDWCSRARSEASVWASRGFLPAS